MPEDGEHFAEQNCFAVPDSLAQSVPPDSNHSKPAKTRKVCLRNPVFKGLFENEMYDIWHLVHPERVEG